MEELLDISNEIRKVFQKYHEEGQSRAKVSF